MFVNVLGRVGTLVDGGGGAIFSVRSSQNDINKVAPTPHTNVRLDEVNEKFAPNRNRPNNQSFL